jgi:sulfotransferase family protein
VKFSRTSGGSVGKLPNFLVIGAMRAGTSSLYQYLRVHPQIYMPPAKELSFFASEPDRRRLEWYRKQFAPAGPEAVAIGEASTIYTKYPRFPGVPERIAALVPEARLVYTVRDPIDRIRSHFHHQVAVRAERAPFERAVFENPIYVDYSRYTMQIEQYLQHFPREQLLIIISEDLRTQRLATLQRVYEFLGVDAHYVPPNLDREYFRTDERVAYPPLAWRIRRALKKRFPASKRVRLAALPLVRALGRAHNRSESIRSAGRVVLTDDVREGLIRLLEEDVRRLRAYAPPDFGGWGIA